MTRIKFILLFLVPIILTLNSQVKNEFLRRNIQNQEFDIELPYRLYIPDNYDSLKYYPLILALHGLGECGEDNEIQIEKNNLAYSWADSANQVKYPCFVLVPQNPSSIQNWDTDEVYATVNNLLDSMIFEFSIDTNRLYITGLSLGGNGTWQYIIREPDKFAAAVPMSGWCNSIDEIENILHIPIWNFHGSIDNTVSIESSRIIFNLFQELGRNPIYFYCRNSTCSDQDSNYLNMLIDNHVDLIHTEYTRGQHVIWEGAYDDPFLFKWIFNKYKINPNAIKLNNIIKHSIISGDLELNWSAENPDDTVEINYSNDNGYNWKRIYINIIDSQKFVVNSNDFEDTPYGIFSVVCKNNKGFVYGKDITNSFIINNQDNGKPYVKILNNEFVLAYSYSKLNPTIELLLDDPEKDNIEVNIYISINNGLEYSLLNSYNTISDTAIQHFDINLEDIPDNDYTIIKVEASDGSLSSFDSTVTFKFNNPNYPVEPDFIEITNNNSIKIFQNYPNPFHESTTFNFILKEHGDVVIDLYDILGKHTTNILSENLSEGIHQIEWFAEDINSGIYTCIFKSKNYIKSFKVMIY